MISWLQQWIEACEAVEGYLRAAREQRITFSMDEFNRLCDAVSAKWSQRPIIPVE